MPEKIHIALESIQIAKPCRADWDAMTGDERARFCGSCQKNVYDLSQMSREAAEKLILEKEGNLCVRLYRRQDGTVITNDCPVGISIARRPFKWLAAGFAALMVSGVAVANTPTTGAPQICNAPTGSPVLVEKLRDVPVLGAIVNRLSPPVSMVAGGVQIMGKPAPPPPIMGDIAMPAPTPTPAPQPSPEPSPAPTGEPNVTMGEPAPIS